MSSSLAWKPHESRGHLPDELKFALREEYGEPVNHTFTNSDLKFLRGLQVAKVKGADKLIQLIEKYAEVEITEEW